MPMTLFHGDCLDIMPTLPAGSVDMVLADLPYGTTACKWDAVIPFEPLWREYRRLCKPNAAIVLTASQPFTSALVMSNPKAFKHEWVWEKNKASGHLNAKKRPMRAHEDIVVFSLGTAEYFPQKTTGHKPGNYARTNANSENYGAQVRVEYGGETVRYPRSVIPFPVVNNDSPDKFHSTQKPVALMEYLIRTYTNEGDTILDNTMGSGTTGVACANTGRSFIGIEKDAAYFEIAQKRLEQAVKPKITEQNDFFD